MKVKRSKTEDALDVAGLSGVILGGTAGSMALQDRLAYEVGARKALRKARASGIDSPAIDITKKANKKRIKTISQNDFGTINNMIRKHNDTIINNKAVRDVINETALDLSSLTPEAKKAYKVRMDSHINAAESKLNQLKAARELRGSRRAGKLAVGATTIGLGAIGANAALRERRKRNKDKTKNDSTAK